MLAFGNFSNFKMLHCMPPHLNQNLWYRAAAGQCRQTPFISGYYNRRVYVHKKYWSHQDCPEMQGCSPERCSYFFEDPDVMF